ncbi:hypothetical protein JCM14076_20130 [Methylosoma difficile]
MKTKQPKRLGVVTLATALLSMTQLTYAFQPEGISWRLSDTANREGVIQPGFTRGGDSQVYINLSIYLDRENPNKLPLLVLARGCGEDPEISGKPLTNLERLLTGRDSSPIYDTKWVNPGPRWRVCPQSDALLIQDETSSALLALEVDFLRAETGGYSPRIDLDVYQLSEEDVKSELGVDELARKYRNLPPNARVPVSVDYSISKDNFKLSSYAEAYGSAQKAYNPKLAMPAGIKGSLGYTRDSASVPVNLESFRRKLAIPGSTAYDKTADLQAALRATIDRGSAKDGQQICYPENPVTTSPFSLLAAAAAPISHTISGRFSTKWTSDHSLHSAFGFRVEVWRVSPAVRLGSAWVEADGNWTIGVPATLGYTGGSTRINYISYNSYYAPQDKDGNRYWWSDTWNVTTTSFNTGHRYVDTDGGTYNGVGELVNSAMTMWSRLYWDAGIDPVAAAPIKFFFPNTWYDCGDGSNNPWSCATFEGDQIWLIAAHGVQGDVVNHEMGHALQAKFWGGKRAAGSGGSHTLSGCYPTRLGLALGEGFANFMAAWVGYPDRNQADGSFNVGQWALSFDAEQRTAPPSCTNGWENETWVARTFWDLHDTRADGDDVLWFNYKGAVISLFLNDSVVNSGDARDMRYYRNVYKNAASAGHQGYIDDIFNQNRQ